MELVYAGSVLIGRTQIQVRRKKKSKNNFTLATKMIKKEAGEVKDGK